MLKSRITFVFATLLITAGALGLFISPLFFGAISILSKTIFFTLILVGVGIYTFLYLQGYIFQQRKYADEYRYMSEQEHKMDYRELYNKFRVLANAIKASLDKGKRVSINLSDKDKTFLFTELSNVVKDKLSSEIISTIKKTYSEKIIKESKLSELLSDLGLVKERLIYEINKLSSRANVNLTIGSITTIGAATFLGYIVLNSSIEFKNTMELLSHYLPRLSVIIFIEFFAFFFLKLYRANLYDIKYYHNELTSLESKFISLKSAIMVNNEKVLAIVIEELSKTERNFELKSNVTEK